MTRCMVRSFYLFGAPPSGHSTVPQYRPDLQVYNDFQMARITPSKGRNDSGNFRAAPGRIEPASGIQNHGPDRGVSEGRDRGPQDRAAIRGDRRDSGATRRLAD